MQAIILAAGMGKRLGKYTVNNTKCMLELRGGKKLIDFTLENLRRAGITKVIMVVGHAKNNLINYVNRNYKDLEVEYIINPLYYKTNNIYSLYLAKDKLAKDDTILLESDVIFEYRILEKLIKDERPNLAVVDKYDIWMEGTCVAVDNEDNIVGFFDKESLPFLEAEENILYKTVNIYKFSRTFSKNVYLPFLEAYMEVMGKSEYYEAVIRVIANLRTPYLKALKLQGEKWYEIDDAHDKINAEIIFAPDADTKLQLLQSRYGGYWRFPRLKDFCYLVNPYFPPKNMVSEFKFFSQELITQYPSGQEIQRILAGRIYQIEPQNLIVGNGASEFIKYLGNAINGNFGIIYPTFEEYVECIGSNRLITMWTNNKDFKYGKDELLTLADKCDNLLLINPDNPSGNFIPKQDILTLLDFLKKKGKFLIIDESFMDFADNSSRESLVNQTLINKYPNLVIIKSLSKSYGIPGIRLGILISSNKEIINSVQKRLPIWNISSFGEFFLQILTKYKKNYLKSISLIREERKKFFTDLQRISYIRPISSQANFFTVEVTNKYTATELTKLLLWHWDIFVKDLTGKKGIKGSRFIRIAIRNSKDNKFLVEKLRELE